VPISALVATLRSLPTEEQVHKYAAIAIANMAQDGDVLPTATVSEVVPALLTSMRTFSRSESVQSECCRAISKLCTVCPDATALCFRLGALPAVLSAVRVLPKQGVLLRAFTALAKLCLHPDTAAAAAEGDVRLVETVLGGLLEFPADVQLRRAACKALECIQTVSRSDVAALFKAAVPGSKTDAVALWAVAALCRGGGEATCNEFLQSGMVRMLADIFATSRNTDMLEAACAVTAAVAAAGDVPPPPIVQLAPSIEAALARCSLSTEARSVLAVIRRNTDAIALSAITRGFCASATASPSPMVYTRPCSTCGGGVRLCDICAAHCHASHTAPDSRRTFGVHGACSCQATECKTIRLRVNQGDGTNFREASVPYSSLVDVTAICAAALAAFDIPEADRGLFAVEAASGDPLKFANLVPGTPLSLEQIPSHEVPLQIRIVRK